MRRQIFFFVVLGSYKLLIVCFICFFKFQMVELLVAHGANLDSRSVLEETPLGKT